MSLAPVVVGSGPSGVAVAAALIAAGRRPIIIDPGLMPGSEAMRLREEVLVEGPRALDAKDAASQDKQYAGQKAWFGSHASFDQPLDAGIDYDPGIHVRASFAVGGFSRVWGGTFAFHEEFLGWPAQTVPSAADLALVRDLVPSSVTSWDGLTDPVQPGRVPGAQASAEAMRRFQRADSDGRWELTPSTVAIDTRAGQTGCRPCGLCLSGCPHDSIWFAGDQIQRWISADAIDYRPGHRVVSLSENSERALVHVDRGGVVETISTSRVFVAAGAIGTAAILINSNLVGSLTVQDTSTAFVAALSLRPDPASLPSHALSQWWVKSEDGLFSAQVYAPNRLHVARLAERLPAPARRPTMLERLALRLHPVIAYLDPQLSDKLLIAGRGGRVQVSAVAQEDAQDRFLAYLRALSATFGRAGYVLPVPATEFSPPGTGYHSGASLPHGRDTDTLGRLLGTHRIHVVDGSVIPSLEVGSVTPTIMANAVRIGRQSLQEDR